MGCSQGKSLKSSEVEEWCKAADDVVVD